MIGGAYKFYTMASYDGKEVDSITSSALHVSHKEYVSLIIGLFKGSRKGPKWSRYRILDEFSTSFLSKRHGQFWVESETDSHEFAP